MAIFRLVLENIITQIVSIEHLVIIRKEFKEKCLIVAQRFPSFGLPPLRQLADSVKGTFIERQFEISSKTDFLKFFEKEVDGRKSKWPDGSLSLIYEGAL